MDVFTYRRIVLNNLHNCTSLLTPLNQNMIERGHCFIQNEHYMCTGWLIFGRIYPVFQSTRHKIWLDSINTGLEKEIIKRKRRRRQLISNILLKIKVLPTDIITLIIDNI